MHTNIHSHTPTCTRTYAHRHIATHTHVYTHLTHVYTHTCMQTHMHTYMHVCRGAHTHIHRRTDTRAGWGENSSPGLPFLFTLPQDPTLGPRLPQEGAADRCQGPPPGLRRVPEVSSSIPLGASTPLLFRRFADHPLLAEGLRVHLSKRAEEPRGGPVISITAGPGGSHCLLHVRGFSPGKVASVLCSCLSWRSSVLTPRLFSCG